MAHIRRFLPLSQKNKNPQECYHILKIIICITVGWKKGHLTSWKPVIIVVKGSYPIRTFDNNYHGFSTNRRRKLADSTKCRPRVLLCWQWWWLFHLQTVNFVFQVIFLFADADIELFCHCQLRPSWANLISTHAVCTQHMTTWPFQSSVTFIPSNPERTPNNSWDPTEWAGTVQTHTSSMLHTQIGPQ